MQLEARLFPNLQFIYELHLAQKEMEALAHRPVLAEDFRSFSLNSGTDADLIKRRSAYVAEVGGEPTDYRLLTLNNVTKAFNQYATHWFYPYKGKYHPQMVRGLANIIGLEPGQTLLDPFSGSGTTVVEGALFQLQTIGFDISPLCVLIGKVKANSLHHLSEIEKHLQTDHESIDPGWHQKTVEKTENPVTAFDLLAHLIAKSDEARRGRDFIKQVAANRQKMLDSVRLMKSGCETIGLTPYPARVELADARKLPLESNSVDGIITSPPYSIALNYVQNDVHSLEAMGYDLDRIKTDFIGVRGGGMERFELYEHDMETAYAEMARVLKPGCKAAVVLGNVTFQGQEIDTVDRCVNHAEKAGLVLCDQIEKLIYGLYNVMQREWILIFNKQCAVKNTKDAI